MRMFLLAGVSLLMLILTLGTLFVQTLDTPTQSTNLIPTEQAVLPYHISSYRSAKERIGTPLKSVVTVTPQPTATPLPTPTPTATPLPGYGPEMLGELMLQTRRYDLYVGINSLTFQDVQSFLPRVDLALDELEQHFGTTLHSRASVAIYQPSRRPFAGVRALAFSDQRRIELYYAPYEDPEGVVRVIVHELAHQYQTDRYGHAVQRRSDVILQEGLATWLAGSEWLQPYGTDSWQERARQLQQAGRLRSLLDDPSGAAANDAYEGWAAFVEYLITTYGWESFDALYCSGRGNATGSADYQAVYGMSLDELADAWRASLVAIE